MFRPRCTNRRHGPGRRSRRALVLLSAAGLLSLGAAGNALGAPSGTSSARTPAASAASSTSARPGGSTPVTLGSGDRVDVAAGPGGSSYLVPRTPGGSTMLTSFQFGTGDAYVLPFTSTPQVGGSLDLSRYDVTALARGGVTAGVTAGASDNASDASTQGPDTQVAPHYPMYRLQINATDLTGALSDPLVMLVNTDDMTRMATYVQLQGGVARVAVPAGNYSLAGEFGEYDAQGNLTTARLVTVTDLAVGADGTNVTLDEKTASSRVSATTPRPSTQDGGTFSWTRRDATGDPTHAVKVWFGEQNGDVPFYVNPQPAAKVGALHFMWQWDAAGTDTTNSPTPYRYDLTYASSDVPADNTEAATDTQLATVKHDFSTDPAGTGTGSLMTNADDAWTSGVGWEADYAMPGTVTQYLRSAPGVSWEHNVWSPSPAQSWQSTPHTFAARHAYLEPWAHGPLAGGMGQYTGPGWTCLGCVADGTLGLRDLTLVDSVPDHIGYGYADGTFTLYQNGQQVVSQAGGSAQLTGVPAATTTYRAVYDQDFSPVIMTSQSTHVTTDVTFVYRPGQADTALPAGDKCTGQSATTPCQILPALTVNYQLAADLTNTSASAVQTMGVNVGHLAYDGHGSHAAITSAHVSVSFDGGSTWQPAAVAGYAGHYVAAWHNPASAAGTDPSLKITATDNAGGSLTQTIAHAYTIAAATS
ncbi:hypothetical protein AB0399_18360 [Streptomyces sp. NPDC088194]|uniref:hypothetical protein n=1 Tax=Streptomyces sp. NPDC088194 TaxID=3154931 RepID=UPI00344EB847